MSLSDLVNEVFLNHYCKIEKYLRDLKEKEAPELSDEEFGRLFIIEHYFGSKAPYSLVRLKTVDELLEGFKCL